MELAFLVLRFGAKGRDDADRIMHSWQFLRRLPAPSIAWLYPQTYQFSESALYFRFLKFFRLGRGFVAPPLRIEGATELLQTFQRNGPVILVTLHTGVVTGILCALDKLGMTGTLIAADVDYNRRRTRELWGDQAGIDIISSDANVFVLARERLGKGRNICVCVDYALTAPESRRRDYCISNAMFEFAERMKVDIVFALSRVGETGEVKVSFRIPRKAGISSRGISGADYADWLESEHGIHRDWIFVDRRQKAEKSG